ncbi:hypothetical protein M5D96_002448 [Drosophila gunungcola]|uniref:Uncharacterized protein n=1 Tax=Drosophila gunungcola TaxID=103775 RepID=A0A9P9Z013_9MUSC|nr:hypothetical protein M5D96_002448 [Drosophila gunungcola]
MIFPKFLRAYIALVFLVSMTHHLTFANHIAIIGNYLPTDTLLLSQDVFVKGRKKGRIAHKFYYTQKTDPKVISAIILKNCHKFSFGSDGVLLEGGPNNIYTAIRLSARKNYNIDYNIKIYSNNRDLEKHGK